MKNLIMFIALVFLSTTTASAIYFDDEGIPQGYRGFADLSYTLGVGDLARTTTASAS